MHGGENAVRARLQRHMKMLSDSVVGREEGDEIPGDIERLNGADAQALDGGLVENAEKEVDESNARREIAAVGAEIDATEHYFPVAGFAEIVNLPEHFVARKAAAPSAHKGDHAIGAAAV